MRKCKTCQHPKISQINKDLVTMWKTGESFRKLSQKYHLPYDSLWRHFMNCIPRKLMLAEEKKQRLSADRLSDVLEEEYQFVKKMERACDRYLTDPEQPGEYYLGPRGEDVEISYSSKVGKQWVQKKESLNALIAKMEEWSEDWQFENVHWKHADPRKLILDAVREARGFIETAAKLAGRIQDVQVNLNYHILVEQFQDYWKPKFPKEYDEFIEQLISSREADAKPNRN